MSAPVNEQTYIDYKSRINNVYDYIETNIDKEMSLAELAAVSHFSKYHFSRIFEAMVGETPFAFIRRLRLEKAATLLSIYPDKTVTEISFECGFNDLSVFSRNFTDHFEKSPTEWRRAVLENSNYNQTFKKAANYINSTDNGNHNMEQLQSVEIKQLSEATVVYIRHTGPYNGDEELFTRLFDQLFCWAKPRGLMGNDPHVIFHDDQRVTDNEKLRMSVCLPVSADTFVNGEVGKMKLPGGRFVVARFVIAPQDMPQAWQWVYGSWLPSSGYQPEDALPFERYPKPPKRGEITVDICVPVKPL